MTERGTRKLRMQDGRTLAYCEYGHAYGYPVLLFHGTPGSRYWFLDEEPIAKELGIRLLTLDRPGYGGSDPQPGRDLNDWVSDIQEATRQWQLDEFSIMGVSGGGAYAATCAYHGLPGLRSVAMVSSAMPFENGKPPKKMSRNNRLAFWLSRYLPWFLRSMMRAQVRMIDKRPELFKKSLRDGNTNLPPSDRAILLVEEYQESMMVHLREAHRQGGDEMVRELRLLARPWGIELSKLATPTFVYHGMLDTMTPVDDIKRYLQGATHIQMKIVKDAGHFLIEDETLWREILLALRDH